MKPADQCVTLQEIHECIDQIDHAIIDNLALRASYIRRASAMKTQQPVAAADAVNAMLEDRRQWAQARGISAAFAQELFMQIMAFFVREKAWTGARENSVLIEEAAPEDAPAILALQKRAFLQEVEKAGGNYQIPPMTQTLAEMRDDFTSYIVFKAVDRGRIVGSARAKVKDGRCYIGRVVVEPVFQGQGYGKALMSAIESRFPETVVYELFTGENSLENIRFYTKLGFVCEEAFEGGGIPHVWMRKWKSGNRSL